MNQENSSKVSPDSFSLQFGHQLEFGTEKPVDEDFTTDEADLLSSPFAYALAIGLGTIFATAPRNTHCAYSPAAILAGYVVKCVIESSQRAPREL